jgi:hypothetical protein
MVTPPVAQVFPATTDVTRTAAFKPLRLVTVHVEVEPLQTSNWLVLHTYQTWPSVVLLQVGRLEDVSASFTLLRSGV